MENLGVVISSQHSACRLASSRTDEESFWPAAARALALRADLDGQRGLAALDSA